MKKIIFIFCCIAVSAISFTSCKSSKGCQCPYPVSSSIEVDEITNAERA